VRIDSWFMFQVLNRTSVAKQSGTVVANLSDLAPFTRYEVTIDCIPLIGDGVRGFWSEPVSLNFSTEEDGSYSITSSVF